MAVGAAVAVAVGVAVAVAVGVAVAVAVGVAVAVAVGVGVPNALGPWIATVIGDPVLKKPTVAVVLCGGLSASKRKLYIVPQRIAFAFGSCPNESVPQVIAPKFWELCHAALL